MYDRRPFTPPPRGPGRVYVLTNPHMPGLVKIGGTSRNAWCRARELSAATGVPGQFTVEYEAHHPDWQAGEALVHQHLRHCRLTGSEHFRCDVSEAVEAVRYVCGGGYVPRAPVQPVYRPWGRPRRRESWSGVLIWLGLIAAIWAVIVALQWHPAMANRIPAGSIRRLAFMLVR